MCSAFPRAVSTTPWRRGVQRLHALSCPPIVVFDTQSPNFRELNLSPEPRIAALRHPALIKYSNLLLQQFTRMATRELNLTRMASLPHASLGMTNIKDQGYLFLYECITQAMVPRVQIIAKSRSNDCHNFALVHSTTRRAPDLCDFNLDSDSQ